jgi:hypothetical protein
MKLRLRCQFFHENHKFFLVLEITATEDSLILIFFFQRTKTSNSLILKQLKNWELVVFKTFKYLHNTGLTQLPKLNNLLSKFLKSRHNII